MGAGNIRTSDSSYNTHPPIKSSTPPARFQTNNQWERLSFAPSASHIANFGLTISIAELDGNLYVVNMTGRKGNWDDALIHSRQAKIPV
jgi:hypothetical protein